MRTILAVMGLVWGLRFGGPAPERTVFLAPEVRQHLANTWDTTNVRQHERAYCLATSVQVNAAGDSVWYVHYATRAIAVSDGPAHVLATCGSRPTLHTHVPTSCEAVFTPGQVPTYDYTTCRLGGPGKDVTWASPFDQESLDRGTAPFEVIQFAADGFTVYYPRGR